MSRLWYNSCRHRACPQCAYLQTERWLALQQARLLPCDHYHVIFTLPHDLNPLWLANVSAMTTLFFQVVRDTLGILLADPKYLGAQPGIIAALHTWSQTLLLHPHLHGLVTGGGLTPAGQWVAVRNGFLLPARVVMAVFRGKMVDAIRQTFARGELALPEAMRPQQLLNLLNRLGHPTQTKWNVCIRERYRHGAGVVTYLARYLRGGPIKNARLVAWDGERVTFLYRVRSTETDEGTPALQRMTLSVADFLQRWLQHVPVPQTRVVRSYGLYHPMHAEALTLCARHSGNRRWSYRRAWTGRRCVPSVGRLIQSGVRPVGSSLCARASSRVGVRLPAYQQRSAPHDNHMVRKTCPGRRVPGGGPGTGHHGLYVVPQAVTAPGPPIALSHGGAPGPVAGRMPWE